MIEEVGGDWFRGTLRKVVIRTNEDMLHNVQEFNAYEIEIETDKVRVVIAGCHDCGPEVIHALPHDSPWNGQPTINDSLNDLYTGYSKVPLVPEVVFEKLIESKDSDNHSPLAVEDLTRRNRMNIPHRSA